MPHLNSRPLPAAELERLACEQSAKNEALAAAYRLRCPDGEREEMTPSEANEQARLNRLDPRRLPTVDDLYVRDRRTGRWKRPHVAVAVAARSRCPQPAGRAAVARVSRPREQRHRRRQSSRSSSSSGDPGPSDPEPEPSRVCACGCGRDISHKRADALTYDSSCRKKLERARVRTQPEQRVPLSIRECDCGRAILLRDPDGDALCAKCGHHRGPLSRVNGYDAALFEMVSNGVRAHHRRSLPHTWHGERSAKVAA